MARRCLQHASSKGASRAACLRIASKVLAQAAAQRGSRDNITVLLIDLQRQQQAQPSNHATEGSQQKCSGGSALDAHNCDMQTEVQPAQNSPLRAAPATPRIHPPPAAAILTPRSKSCTAAAGGWQGLSSSASDACSDQSLRQPLVELLRNGEVVCRVHATPAGSSLVDCASQVKRSVDLVSSVPMGPKVSQPSEHSPGSLLPPHTPGVAALASRQLDEEGPQLLSAEGILCIVQPAPSQAVARDEPQQGGCGC